MDIRIGNDMINGMGMNPGFHITGIQEKGSITEIKGEPCDNIHLSKRALEMMHFSEKIGRSEMGKKITAGYMSETILCAKEKQRQFLEEWGVDTEPTGYDEDRHKLYKSLYGDLCEMRKAGEEYYAKNGTYAGVKNAELSKNTTAIEYKDLEILVDVEEELNKINRADFSTEAEYYDAVLETIYDSKLSDKAKGSIGGYVEKLKERSLEDTVLSKKDKMSAEQIEKELERIKLSVDKENKAGENIKMDWDRIIKLNKKLTNVYINYLI